MGVSFPHQPGLQNDPGRNVAEVFHNKYQSYLQFTSALFLSAAWTRSNWRRDVFGQKRSCCWLPATILCRAYSCGTHRRVSQCWLGQCCGFLSPWFGSLHLEKALVPGWQTGQHKCANHTLADVRLCWLASEKWYTWRPHRQITAIYSLWMFWNLDLEQVHCFLFLLEIDQRTCWSLLTPVMQCNNVCQAISLGCLVGWA